MSDNFNPYQAEIIEEDVVDRGENDFSHALLAVIRQSKNAMQTALYLYLALLAAYFIIVLISDEKLTSGYVFFIACAMLVTFFGLLFTSWRLARNIRANHFVRRLVMATLFVPFLNIIIAFYLNHAANKYLRESRNNDDESTTRPELFV